MKTLLTPALVALVVTVFSAHSIAATDHDAHSGHGAMQAPTVKEPVHKIDKPTGKVTASQVGVSSSNNNLSRSGSVSSDGHAHDHANVK